MFIHLSKILSLQKHSNQKIRRTMETRRSTIVSPARHIRDYNFRNFLSLVLIGCLLAFVAGYVNTTCIVGAFRLPLTAVTGSTSKMAIVIAEGRLDIGLHFIFLIFSFILGNSISGALVGGSSFRIQRHYGLVLLLESLTLALGSLFENVRINFHSEWESLSPSAYLVCLGCGLQNGMCTTFSGAVIRTTHVTGTVTDIGLIIGQAIFHKRTRKHLWKLKILIPLYISFSIGAIIGWFAYEFLHNKAILVPCALIGLLGIGHICYCQIFLNYKIQNLNEDIFGSQRVSSLITENNIDSPLSIIVPDKQTNDSDQIDSDEDEENVLQISQQTQTSLTPLVVVVGHSNEQHQQTIT